MDIFVERCAGIDIGKKDVKACLRIPSPRKHQRHSEVRTFATTSRGLAELCAWLAANRVQLVGMESTGCYWKPVFYALEEAGLSGWLLNARHVKNVPGRKSDVSDAAWLAMLVEHGLVRPSFVPPPPIRRLRDLTRARTTLAHQRTRLAQRLHNVLEDAGIKLDCVLTDILGVSGRRMLAALIGGQRDPKALTALAHPRVARAKLPALQESLTGHFTDHHAHLCQRLLDQYDFGNQQIAGLDTAIDTAISADPALARARQLLVTIPGVSHTIAEIIIAETGADMSRFPTAEHLCSWAGMAPGSNESAGRHRPVRTRRGDTWLRGALGQAAAAASHTKRTHLAARYHHLGARRGKQRALIAVGRAILEAAWHMLTTNTAYHDLGADHYQARRRHHRGRRAAQLAHELTVLGYQVTITDPAPV